MKTNLEKKLSYVSGYRKYRIEVAEYILLNKEEFPTLLNLCFLDNKEISHKACWVTEFVCKSNLTMLFPELNYFIKNLASLTNDSSIRPMAKVCEILCESYFQKKNKESISYLTEPLLEKLIEINFDWLISDVKVATKAYAMRNLYLLGKKFDWIYPELKPILLKDIPDHSAAYKARAKHILDKI
ncbi:MULTISPECIES: hypothetical protein [Galbibacter]|uniref:hypothetical protein n=1 Tax=Galbibacter orientalis TaxID=453852 RepID=UPI003003175C